MVKKLVLIALSTALLHSSHSVYAGCDPCIQTAANSASSTMQAAINTTTSAVQANVSATNALNTSINTAATALQATLQANQVLLIRALSNQSMQNSTLLEANNKVLLNTADHIAKSVVDALKKSSLAEMINEHKMVWGPNSLPLSGDIGAMLAEPLKIGEAKSLQNWQEYTKYFREYQATHSPASKLISQQIKAAKSDESFSPVPLLTKSRLTNDEAVQMNELIMLMVDPDPLEPATDEQLVANSQFADYEIKRKLHNAGLQLAHSVLSKSVAERVSHVPISEDSWQIGYTTATPDADGKTSIMSVYDSEANGRVGAIKWFENIKTVTEAGLLREQVAMQAMRNKMLLRMMKQEEEQLALLSLLTIKEVHKNRPTPPTK